jgi:hypothetical protein
MMNRNHWQYSAAIGSILAALTLAVAMPASATGKISHPTAPLSVHATAGNASATVRWSKPSSNGGAAIRSYVVTSHPTGKTCATRATKCTVVGLKNRTAYTFTVVAKNRVGTSPGSKASNKVMPKAPTTTSPKLVVSPSVNLTKGETVKVSGTGFTPNDVVDLVECLKSASGESGCDIATATPVTINAAGVLPSTNFNVVTGTIGTGKCGTTASNLTACTLSAGNAGGGDSASTPISFRAP